MPAVAAGLVPAAPAGYLVIAPDGSSVPARHPRARGSARRRRSRGLSGAEHASAPGRSPRAGAPGSRRSGSGLSVGQRVLRNQWGLALMILLLVLIVGRLAIVQGVDGAAYANAAEQDRLRTYPIAALRGAVLDRDGNPFAYTVDASRVVADPTVVTHPARTARALAALLDVPEDQLTAKLSQENRYVVLAGQVSPETTDAIDELELPGISFEDDPVRLYPAGAVGGQVVGFVGHDGTGLAGIEQTFEDELAGHPGTGGSRWAAAATRSPRGSTSRPPRPTATPCS